MSDEVQRRPLGTPTSESDKPNLQRRLLRWLPLGVLAVVIIAQLVFGWVAAGQIPVVDYSAFKQQLMTSRVTEVELGSSYYTAIGVNDSSGQAVPLYRTVPVPDDNLIPLLDEQGIDYYAVPERSFSWLGILITWGLPLVVFFWFFRRISRTAGRMGSDILSIGKSRSRVVPEGSTGVMFDDVAGADEAKAELEEIVDFLKRPGRYAEVGGRIPKGVLLVGAPGTGKTLLARAVAGEAHVPFISLSGSDFVEMFVGVGSSRVRDLFKQARAKSPSIVFIDELDAIGKSRATSGMASNDEREQTLNQLLVEMDGFDASTGVIVLAATNRPEILDPALLRPGRFDRQVVVDKPDLAGREQILRLHARGVKLSPNVDFNRVARATAGLAGADLANIVNEAALLAVRGGRKLVEQDDFSEAIEKTLAGLSRRNRVLEESERRIVAYHETGHALAAHLSESADPVEKISIVPRGMSALGYTLQLPTEERFLLTRGELLSRVDVLLAGRAAEELIFGDISTGAGNDLTRAAEIVRSMITDYGMSERFRNVHLPVGRAAVFLHQKGPMQREYSESTQAYVDEETARIIAERYQFVYDLLDEHREELETVAEELLKEEVIDRERFVQLVG
jgi:cell division protease FtsH